ncbi:MAG: hypothetical protein MHPSP_002988, partial [Paramarteilia canceri]
SNSFRHLDQDRGAVLVFLPGLNEIERMYSLLSQYENKMRLVLIRLHSQISLDEQQLAFKVYNKSQRKVILATNIAESSITVPDIIYASLEQRKGRAGRLRPGIVYRMCTNSFYQGLDEFPVPEMLRSSLDHLILKIKLLDLDDPCSTLMNALDPPDTKDITKTINRLKMLGALEDNNDKMDGKLTFLGEVLAKLPIDMSLGKLIVYGFLFGVMDECIIIAAILSLNNLISFRMHDKFGSF